MNQEEFISQQFDQLGVIPYRPQQGVPNPKSVDYPMTFNSVEQLDNLQELLAANQEFLQIKNVQWNSPGHYDHLHVDFY